MIHVDVTAACLLPLQSGIPRTTRGLFRSVSQIAPDETLPIFWQPFRGSYTHLSSRSHALLTESPAAPGNSSQPPRDSTLPLLRAAFSDLKFWPAAIPLRRTMRPEDTLLLTSLFPDNRLSYLRKLAPSPGRKIAIFHDAIPLHDPNVPNWERRRHIEALRILARMNLVIAVSAAAQEDLQNLWRHDAIQPAPTEILPWPVPFTETRPPFSDPPRVPKNILCVSRLKQVKNHATLLEACEILWRENLAFTLDLIGCEDEARESRAITRQITQLQKAGRSISWRAQVPEEELHRAYQRASFTVFPSQMEGFGLPVIESLWHGRAVICANSGAVGDLARAGGCLAIDVNDAEVLAQAIRDLLQNENHLHQLNQEAWARPVRTWTDYARDLQPLLEKR